jgi:hypothetical protein
VLVLISFGLVLVATVLLVLGLVADSGLGLIYVSIACSLAAGVILVVATRVNRPRAETASTGGPAPLPPPEAPTVATTPSPAAVATPIAVPADEEFAPATEAVPAASVSDDMFPIADYDDLTVGEIVPLLPKLYADEIDVVADRERSGKARRQILSKLDELRVSLEGAPDDVTAEEWEQQSAEEAAPVKRAPAKKAAAKKTPAKKAAAPAKKAATTTKKSAAKKAAAPAKKAATKSTAKKAAAPAKKAATTTKKTAAKKAAAPAKKAAKAAKATKKAR